MINPFTPLFAENRVLKLVELFSGQLWTIKSQRCPKRSFQVKQLAAFYCRCKISAFKVRECTECKSRDTEVSTFTFRFVSFVCGTVFGILFDGRKQRCVVEKGFHLNFPVNLTWLFSFYSGLLDWIESHSFLLSLRELFPLHKLDHKVVLGRLRLWAGQTFRTAAKQHFILPCRLSRKQFPEISHMNTKPSYNQFQKDLRHCT